MADDQDTSSSVSSTSSGRAREKYRAFLDEGIDGKTRQFYIDARMAAGELGSDPNALPSKN